MTNEKTQVVSPELPPLLLPDELAELSAGMQHVDIASKQSDDTSKCGEAPEKATKRQSPRVDECILTEEISLMSRCPSGRPIRYDAYWYRLTDMPEDEPISLTCSLCFVELIKDTELAGEFELVLRPRSVVTTCVFCLPSIRDSVWPTALEAGTVDLLRAHLSRRAKVKPCAGMRGFEREKSSIWYGMVNGENEVQEFMMCEACYLDYAVGSGFELQFSTYPAHWESNIWLCDLRFPYTRRALRECGNVGDWDSFVIAAASRHSLVNCSGDMVAATSTRWYYPRHEEMRDLQICQNCYLDNWGLTAFQDEFQLEHRGPPLGSTDFLMFCVEQWQCGMGLNVPLMMIAEESNIQVNFEVFAEGASVIVTSPSCNEGGITIGEGWTLVGGCDGFIVCHACYVGVLWPVPGVQEYFERTQWRAVDTKPCSLHKSCPRAQQYLDNLNEARDFDKLSIFVDFVREYAPVAVCPRNDAYRGIAWWGYPEARCCAECWVDWFSKTPLASIVPLQGEACEEGQICQLWSHRMRTLWLAVCQAAEVGSEDDLNAVVTEFREVGQHRETVYYETMPLLRRLRAAKYAADRNIAAQAMASVAFGGAEGLAVVSGMTDGHRHGNSGVGWHATESGAMAAQARNNMAASIRAAPSREAQILRLQAVWNEVE